MSAIKFYDFRLICVNAKLNWDYSVLLCLFPFLDKYIMFFGIKLLHLFNQIGKSYMIIICEMKVCTSDY